MQRGFELAREEIAPIIPITFIIENNESTVEGAVASYNKLIHEHGVSIISGIAISTRGAQAFPIAQANKVVSLSSVSSAVGLSAIGDYIFRVPLTVDVLNSNGVRITHSKLGYSRAALIYDAADVYSTSSHQEFEKVLGATAGVEIVAVESFQTKDTNFSTQLTAIMAANPDVIFVSALIPEMTAVMIQGRQLGIPDTVRYIAPELDAKVVSDAGAAAEGAISFLSWFHESDTPDNQEFVESYQAKYGIDPEPWAAQSYAAIQILIWAILEADSTDAPAVRDALADTRDLDTILGKFSFNADGDAVYDPTVLVVEGGALKVFE